MFRTKITIIGDIMCEPRLLQAVRGPAGSYDFRPVFEHVKGLFSEADHVIANLETPLAGEAAGYTAGYFSFNAPAALADAVRDAGIGMVTTMNNHCLDRGFAGMEETLRTLDAASLRHTGTFLSDWAGERFLTFSCREASVALVAYGAHTNRNLNGVTLSADQERTLNLLRPQADFPGPSRVSKRNRKARALDKMLFCLNREQRYAVKKGLGVVTPKPAYDTEFNRESAAPYIDAMRGSIRRAKEQADIVIFYPHLLGQFNPEPGVFSQYAVQQAVEVGCDVIIGSHPHIVQKAEYLSGTPCFWSIGNFSMSPNSVYLVRDGLPEYGLAVHLYVEDRRIVNVTFSILRIVEKKNRPLTVFPADELAAGLGAAERRDLERDVARICRTVTGRLPEGELIRREYTLPAADGGGPV